MASHGFLELLDLDGTQFAVGDVIQRVQGLQVTSRMTLHICDGSLDDETTVLDQRDTFHGGGLPCAKGPSFPKPIDVTI